jgi:hypothetical protein
MDYCEANGNQGFPIPINGQLGAGDQQFKDIVGSAEIYAAFATRSAHAQLVNQSMHSYNTRRRNVIYEHAADSSTLTYNGERFRLELIQIAEPVGGSPWPTSPQGTNIADAIFSFAIEGNGTPSSPRGLHIIVPLYSKESMSDNSLATPKALNYFQQTYFNTITDPSLEAQPSIKSLRDIFDDFRGDASYVQYNTCLQVRVIDGSTGAYRAKRVNQLALFFPRGWILPLDLIKKIGDVDGTTNTTYEKFRLVMNARFDAETATSETPADNQGTWLTGINNWSPHGLCYSGQAVSVGSGDFVRRFRFVRDGLIYSSAGGGGGAQKRLKTTSEYKCLPIDRVKDIDGTNVLLDPATGARSMADALNGTPSQQADLDLSINPDAASNLEKFAIVLGVLCAIAVGLVLLSFAVRIVLNRQGTSEGNEQAGIFAKMLSMFKRQAAPPPQ